MSDTAPAREAPPPDEGEQGRMMRSKLFVPGSRPELFEKALRSEADALSLDLEDAVLPERKAAARQAVGELLARLGASAPPGKLMIVRVNRVGSPSFGEDVEAAVTPALGAINLPKVESADEVLQGALRVERAEARKGLKPGSVKLLVNIESPKGLRLVGEIAAASTRISGVQVGFGDLLAPLRVARHEAALAPIRLAVRMAAAEAGVAAYDAVWPDIADKAGFEADARAARAMGYLGKSCIHPSQVPLANAVFMPTPEEVRFALAVEAAYSEAAGKGRGAFLVEGRMIDGPFLAEALETAALARRLKLAS
jgi:citrate lyase subunit beta/citryl-CoA lyase